MTSNQIKKLRIIHFNDCYNIDEQSESGLIRGGACRFLSALLSEVNENTVVLFSGDILSPSISKFINYQFSFCVKFNFYYFKCLL